MMVASAVLVGVAVGLLATGWRLRWLTVPGAAAGALVGAAVLAGAGPAGLTLLLLFFATSSALTARNRARNPVGGPRGQPAVRVRDMDRAGRGARQVVANGGVAAACALLGLAGWLPLAHYAVAGALAAATADTWATETGTARGGTTRLITSWERVPPGRSGGISAAGTLWGLAGALLIGLAAALLFSLGAEGHGLARQVGGADAGLGFPAGAPGRAAMAVFAGGAAGMTVDSLLGATLETRVERIDNDGVNLIGTLAGAAVCWWLGTLQVVA